MTCTEFERVLPELEGDRSFEQEEHLRKCARCSDLVSDLSAIGQEARLLQASEEPSPRVWNSIEMALRQEGLIRPTPLHHTQRPPQPRWRMGWLVPVAAALLVMTGLAVRQYQATRPGMAQQTAPARVITAGVRQGVTAETVADEDQLLRIVSARNPGLRAGYESNLRAVDAYIQDAELSARDNPNDEISQQYLMNAYEQRAMVYQMAMGPSLQ